MSDTSEQSGTGTVPAAPPPAPAPPKRVVTLSLQQGTFPSADDQKNQRVVNLFQSVFSAVALVAAAVLLFLPSVNTWWTSSQFLVATTVIALIDVFLGLLLRAVVYKCRIVTPEQFPGIPERGPAILILSLLLGALTLAFARFSLAAHFKDRPWDAWVDAIVTTATLNHGQYAVSGHGFWPHAAVVIEVFSVLLLLLVFFPLLVSRLAMFANDPGAPPQPIFDISEGGEEVVWNVVPLGKAPATIEAKSLQVCVTDKGDIGTVAKHN
jgi:hypothetical protein